MKLVLSRFATAELDEILTYLRDRSPAGVTHVKARIRRAFARIAAHPESAEELEGQTGVRRLPLGKYPYVIYYEVIDEQVFVLRILHGARKQPWSSD